MYNTTIDLPTIGSFIQIAVDGTPLFLGMVDDPTDSGDKKKGYAREVKARGLAARWLDTFSSVHIRSNSAYDIAAQILNEYNNRRGAADPLISWKTNHAPINLSYPLFQRRESIQDMFRGLAQLLAAPPGYLGGADCMFDFYVDADGAASFVRVAEEWAMKDGSHLQLNDNHRTITRRETRGTPVKNDVWLWGGQTSGRLPLEMQDNYMNQAPRDVWTENNSGDYGWGVENGAGTPTLSNSQEHVAFGSWAIKIMMPQLSNPSWRVYWYLPFPFNQWPIGQAPNGRLNCFNEAPNYREKKWDGSTWTNVTGMSEQMGEIQGIGFYLYSTASFDWYIELQDHFNHKVRTATERYDVGLWPTAYWKPYLNIPIGPSANMEGSENATEPFDWAAVKEIRWVCKNGPAYSWPIWFDGLRFIKPLVIHYPDYNMSGGANPYDEPWHPAPAFGYRSSTSLSTEIVMEQSVDEWKVGKRIASSIYESKAYPQAYWTIEGFGVTECIPGQKFLFGPTELCMRENRFSITKDGGFESSITAVAPYKSGKWSNECLPDFGRIMKEVSHPIGKLQRSVSGS